MNNNIFGIFLSDRNSSMFLEVTRFTFEGRLLSTNDTLIINKKYDIRISLLITCSLHHELLDIQLEHHL